jgi:outer membrane protein assembly factor BamB
MEAIVRRQHAHPIGRARPGPIRAFPILAGAALLLVAYGATRAPSNPSVAVGAAAAPPASAAISPSDGLGSSTSQRPEPSPASSGEPLSAAPRPSAPPPSAPPPPSAHPGLFPGGLLIADRGNGRLIVITSSGTILWRFPVRGSLPRGESFAADDAFISPDGRTIVANDDTHQVIDRIDIATGRVVWQYGHYDTPSGRTGYLNGPDDAYPLANGDVVVADIKNCRIIQITPAKRIRRQWGRSGACAAHAPQTYGAPNGDTPLPDGGLLITEIRGSRVVRLSATGKVIFDIHVPTAYPSDAHLDRHGNVIVADYSTIGAVVAVTPKGRLLWRYGPSSGRGRLDHPSLAVPLGDGMILINDDFRERVVLLDPVRRRIVWQYGVTDSRGTQPGRLHIPDGVDLAPVGIF